MEGPPFRVPFRMWLPMDSRGLVFHVYYEKLPQKVKYCFKEDSTQRIFRMEEEEIEDAYPGDSDEEGNEIVA